jgi:hypothetical protein
MKTSFRKLHDIDGDVTAWQLSHQNCLSMLCHAKLVLSKIQNNLQALHHLYGQQQRNFSMFNRKTRNIISKKEGISMALSSNKLAISVASARRTEKYRMSMYSRSRLGRWQILLKKRWVQGKFRPCIGMVSHQK